MKLSTRIDTLLDDGDDGWEIYHRSRAMKDRGIDVIELTIGDHDRRTEPEILNAMHAAAIGGHTGYSKLPGTDALRDEVAHRVQSRTGVATRRDNVLIVPGGQSALFACHIAACDPGDTALYIDPYYATYPGTLRGAGAIPKAVRAKAENGFQPDPNDIAAAARDARSLLINSPNNPTGVVYSEDTLSGIARAVQDHDLWLISDEVYDTQLWSGTHISPRQLSGMTERTLVVGSVSKSHAMTGSRLGWIVGPEAAIQALADLATHTTYGVAGFVQDAALFALQQGPDFEARIAAPFRRRHGKARSFLTARGIPTVPSEATMYLMADIRGADASGEVFARRLLEDHSIAVMPGESFGQAAAGHLRIALTTDDDRLMQALDRLADLYDAMKKDTA